MNYRQWDHATSAKFVLEQIDHFRRRRGEILDAAGFGPIETPYRVLHAEPGLRLRQYGEHANDGPVVLFVPAPIKRAYIWDMEPENSVVAHALEQNMRVYLAEWTLVDDTGREFGLAEYADCLLAACLHAIESDTGEREIILMGHSLGGVLATIFSCLYPQRVRALVLLEAPLHFGPDAGNFALMIAATSDTEPIEATFGNVPGSLLNMISYIAAPHAFQWERHVDLALTLQNPKAFRRHLRVERWTHDELPLPGRLFTEIVEQLYRNDELMKGSLCISGRQIGPRNVTMPLLNVIDPRSAVIPPQSVLPFHDAAASHEKKVLHYEGDIGVCIQHVGVLVGTNAHTIVWPAIFDWLEGLFAHRQ